MRRRYGLTSRVGEAVLTSRTYESTLAFACVARLVSMTDAAVEAWIREALIDLQIAVLFALHAAVSLRAAAGEVLRSFDGPEDHVAASDERIRRIFVELVHGLALLIVLAGFVDAQVVLEGGHVDLESLREEQSVRVYALLNILAAEVLLDIVATCSGAETDIDTERCVDDR